MEELFNAVLRGHPPGHREQWRKEEGGPGETNRRCRALSHLVIKEIHKPEKLFKACLSDSNSNSLRAGTRKVIILFLAASIAPAHKALLNSQ